MHVGVATQEVRVSADAAMVDPQNTSISEVMDQQRIVDLPLNGRQATDLILLSGGAAEPPNAASRVVTSHDYVNSVGVSVSGGQINGNIKARGQVEFESNSGVGVSRRRRKNLPARFAVNYAPLAHNS
ncbi:MAG: hypothetical protein ACRD3N_00695 [Terracidiphilus sp.]